ncbi:MAG: hypothetical protein HC915_02615 [Anaerolineae bacterium]|nr:hypothetical protein [Anaerolineae bacterium]
MGDVPGGQYAILYFETTLKDPGTTSLPAPARGGVGGVAGPGGAAGRGLDYASEFADEAE